MSVLEMMLYVLVSITLIIQRYISNDYCSNTIYVYKLGYIVIQYVINHALFQIKVIGLSHMQLTIS